MIDIFVSGVPQPKGSTRAFVVKGRPIITSTNRGVKSWEDTIRHALGMASIDLVKGPVMVNLWFTLPQPASRAPKPKSKDPFKRNPVPDTKPDLDKLARACLDAMNKVAFEDDARVVSLVVSKTYGDPVGVHIVVGGHEG
jgi:Holliday junction resolvase RusA-like endonuclease|tara:strand:+ start:633 stop:1052 length:420 start_codon:yes stop_codon:yes gene_type:complete